MIKISKEDLKMPEDSKALIKNSNEITRRILFRKEDNEKVKDNRIIFNTSKEEDP